MKKLFALLIVLCVSQSCWAALSGSTVFEVESGGSDTNGGGFVTGSGGTDYSQQTSPQASVTDGVTNGSTTITSATANFTAVMVGNIIYVAGGTGSITAGWYQITVRNSATSITVDRSTGLTTGTGVTLKVGGCFATIAPALAQLTVSGMIAYVKAATYNISTGLSFPAFSGISGAPRLVGYSTVRGDFGRPTIKATAAIIGVTLPNNFSNGLENFILDGNSTGTQGALISGTYDNYLYNVTAHHWTQEGVISSGGSGNIFNKVEVYASTGTTGSFVLASGDTAWFSYSHDNFKEGFFFSNVGDSGFGCVSYNNKGDGFDIGSYENQIVNSVAYGNTSNGIESTYGSYIYGLIEGNIFVNNGGYGIVLTQSPVNAGLPNVDYNAFYNNTSGARNNIGAGAHDVTLTGNPFNNVVSSDFSLNNTSGAGAALRSIGFPGTTQYGIGYNDIGPLRHQDPAGSGSTKAFTCAN